MNSFHPTNPDTPDYRDPAYPATPSPPDSRIYPTNTVRLLNRMTPEQTAIIKGLAILLIVLHNYVHNINGIGENQMRYDPQVLPDFINAIIAHPGNLLTGFFAYFGHFGVQLFIFISGYGLTKKYVSCKRVRFKNVFPERLVKIYSLMLFGLLILFCGTALLESKAQILLFLKDALKSLLMLHYFSYDTLYSFIGPWWFFGLIIQLYLVFPFLFNYIKRGFRQTPPGQKQHTLYSTTSAQHPTTSAQHSTTSAQHPATSAQHSTTSVQHSTTSAQHSTTSAQHSTTSARDKQSKQAHRLYAILLLSYAAIYLSLPLTESIHFPLFANLPGHLPEFIVGIACALCTLKLDYRWLIGAILVFIIANLSGYLFPLSFLSATLILLFSIQPLLRLPQTHIIHKTLLFIGKISMFMFVINGPLRTFTLKPFFGSEANPFLLFGGALLHILVTIIVSYIMSLIYDKTMAPFTRKIITQMR